MPISRFPLSRALIAFLVLALAGLACNASTPAAPVITPDQSQPLPGTSVATKPASELVTPAGSTLPANPMGATKVETHIRNGPSTDHVILGTLAAGLPVRLTGRNADKTWLQIEFSASPDGRAWMFAENVNINPAVNVDALPVVNAPPAPVQLSTHTPTATHTAQPATATPTRKPFTVTPKPTAIPILRADRLQLAPGECTTLRWDVDNVKAVFLDAGYGEEPAVGHDIRWVCLDTTTTFTLRVIKNDDSSQKYPLTITVSGECGSTPIIVYFDSTDSNIHPGESTYLRWDVLCAQAVFIKPGNGERIPVVGRDQRKVSPTQTTVYKLIVVAKDNSEIKQELTITVAP